MYKRAYIFTYDSNFTESLDLPVFHNQLTSAKGVANWWHHLENTYILIVDEGVTARNVTDFIMERNPNKKFIVCEIFLDNQNGWLDKKAWDWINEQKIKLRKS
jgi:hypothetical protein